MKKSIIVMLLGLSFLTGCVTPSSVPMLDDAKAKKAKMFKAPARDKAGIYVYRINQFTGSALTKTVWIDKKCIGDTASGVFFYQEVDGNKKHTIATQSEFSPNELTIDTKGGKLYFVEQFIKMGVFVGGADLAVREPSVGKQEVMKLNMAKKGSCSESLETPKK
jgi:hypothetical protein